MYIFAHKYFVILFKDHLFGTCNFCVNMSRNIVKHSFIVTFTFISSQVPLPLNNSKLSCVIELKMFSDLCHLNSSVSSLNWRKPRI